MSTVGAAAGCPVRLVGASVGGDAFVSKDVGSLVGLTGASVGGDAFVGKDVAREDGCDPLTDLASTYQAKSSIKHVFVPCI